MSRPATTISLSISVAVLIGAWFLFTTRVTETRPAFPAATSSPLAYGTESTEAWKVYTNEEYGFEFSYPREWILDTSGSREWTLDTRDGVIYISMSNTWPDYFEQACRRGLGPDWRVPDIETVLFGTVEWKACLTQPEGFTIPMIYTTLSPGLYIGFSHGPEHERQIGVTHMLDYEFAIVRVLRTFHYAVSR